MRMQRAVAAGCRLHLRPSKSSDVRALGSRLRPELPLQVAAASRRHQRCAVSSGFADAGLSDAEAEAESMALELNIPAVRRAADQGIGLAQL
jgi:hypothetical protein